MAAINATASKKAGLPYFSAEELIERTKNDPSTWAIFAKGYTIGVNQCQGAKTIEKLMQYKPRTLQDMSAFVAAIRPGFKSMVQKFLGRQKFSYGVPAFDALLHNDSSGSSWLLYQEDVMKVLSLAGFPMEETYPIIKAISKKKVKVIEAAHQRFIEGFMAYQKDQDASMTDSKARENSEAVWQVLYDSSSYSFNACVTGDTKLWMPNSGCWQPTVGEMFRVMNDRVWARQNAHRSLAYKYAREGYPKALSMFDDHRIRRNKIIDIRMAGERKVYRVTVETGQWIECTDNHKFPTPNGEVELRDLRVGDTLFVRGEYEKTKADYTFGVGASVNCPKHGEYGFQYRSDGPSVLYNEKRRVSVEQEACCERCGAAYHPGDRFEVHHVDGDRNNGAAENLQWLCCSCHKRTHYENGRRRQGEKGYPVLTSKIAFIEYVGVRMTYDVQMTDPAHNFVANDGIVTCNSHSVAVALDAIYGAYLKAHYPHEYYSTLLDVYTAKGNKDKVAEIKAEMLKAFDIHVVPCHFRQDNRAFSYDKAANTISDALPSIKDLSVAVAEELYKMRNEQYDTFVDLLCDMEYRTPFNATNITVLIRMDYFREFGKAGKLMEVWRQFRNGEGIAFKKHHVEATRQKRLASLREFESRCPDEPLSPFEQLCFEAEHYGTPISVFKECRKMYVLMSADTKYSPKLTLYSASTGDTGYMKVRKDTFSKAPLSEGDIIVIGDWETRPRYSYRDGQAVVIPGTKETWLKDYAVVFRAADMERGV